MRKNNSWRCILLLILMGCTTRPEFESPNGYDLSAPEKILMKESLLEISGIAFIDQRADTVFSINDEEGRMYTQPLTGKGLVHTRFAGNGDYEDIAIFREHAFVLRSDGTIFSFPLDSAMILETVTSVSYQLLPKGEYEGLYADEKQQKLYALCKQCKEKKEVLSGHSIVFFSDSLALGEPFQITIQSDQIKNKKNLLPSAFARNTTTGDWFIISSVHKTLWIIDSQWNEKERYALDPKIFIQPEGIAFDHEQNLYISNEGNEIHNGTILKFTFHSN